MQLEEVNYRIFFTTRRYLAFTFAVGAGIALIILVGMLPMGQDAYSTFQETRREQPKLEKLQAKLAQLQAVVNTPEYNQIDLVQKALPSKKPLLEVLTAVNSVASSTRVRIDEFELSPGLVATEGAELETEKSAGPYEELEIKMTVSGSFEQVQEFMVQLEQFAPFTSIVSLELSSTVFNGEQALQASLITNTYYFTQPIRVTVDSPLPQLTQKDQDLLTKLELFQVADIGQQTEVLGGGLEDLFGVENIFEAEGLIQ